MKILSWNVNGLRAIVKKNFIDVLKNEDFEILGIQETKLQADQIPSEIEKIKLYKNWSFAEKKGYSGVATFSKIQPTNIKTGIDIKEFDSEGRILQLDFETFSFLNVYFPNGQKNDERLDYKLRFYNKFFKYTEKLRKKQPNIIICGDYNTAHNEIDLKHPKANSKRSGFLPIERKELDKIIQQGYIDTFRTHNPDTIKYSWWSYRFNARKNNAGWRIDYFFVTKEFFPRIKNAFILNEIKGSDHCPVGIEIKD